MGVKIQLRRDTSTNWTNVNPILSSGEAGLETNTNQIKFGDGTTPWNDLGYYGDSEMFQDIFATSFIVAGSGIDIDYDDPNNTVTINVIPKKYGYFYDTTTQTNVSVTGINTITLNNTDMSNGVSVEDGSKITVDKSGVYNLQFSAQIEKTDGGDDSIEIWPALNNSAIPHSTTVITLHQQDAKTVAAWNFFLPMNSGDNVQLFWYSSDINMRILAQSGLINPIRPDIPSVIVSIVEL